MKFVKSISIIAVTFLIFKYFAGVVLAETICGGIREVWPMPASGPFDSMRTVYANPSSIEYDCNTYKTKRIISDPPPSVTWRPQLANYGTSGHYYEDWTLTYRVTYHQLLNFPDQCVSDWYDIDNSSNKFPQSQRGVSETHTVFMPQFAGVVTIFPWLAGWPTYTPDVPPVEVDVTFVMEKSNGQPLDDGWYQIDIQPSCDGGSTWETGKSLAGTFVRMGCDVPAAVQNVNVNAPVNLAENDRLIISWDPPTPPAGASKADVVSYNVWRYNEATSLYDILAGTVDGDTTTFTDSPLTCNKSYSYKVESIGCSSGNLSAAVSASTNACTGTTCSIDTTPLGQSPACVNTDETKQFSVINNVVNPIAINYWGASFVNKTITKPASPDNVINFNATVSNIENGLMLFNDGSVSCVKNVTVYPKRNMTVQVKTLASCSDLPTGAEPGVDGKQVNYVSTNSSIPISGANTTNISGDAVLAGLTFVNSDILACTPIDYKISLNLSDFSGYTFCDSSSTGWAQEGAIWKYDLSGSSTYTPNITIPTVYFEGVSTTEPTQWLTLKQGNYAVGNSGLDMEGTGAENVITLDGTVHTFGTIDITNGNLGPEDAGVNDVFTLENYTLSDSTAAIDKVLELDDSRSNVTNLVCNAAAPADPSINVVIYEDCDLTLSATGNKIKDNIEMVLIKNGTLTIGPDVTELNSNIIVDGDLEVETHPTNELIVNGYMWAKGSLAYGRKVTVNSNFEYIDDETLYDIIPTGIVHWVEFD